MNNKNDVMNDIKEFLDSDKKCMLIKGTNQYKKHLIVMAMIDKYYKNAKVLFRVNAMENVNDNSFLGDFIKRKPRSGETIRIESNKYEIDSFNSRTWIKTSSYFDFAILYPLDAIKRKDVSIDCISDLFNSKKIGKVFVVTWTDTNDEFSMFNKFIDCSSTYDAEEEDLAYHKRVLEFRD